MKIILCCGLKRAGSTLQFNLVRRVLEGNQCSYINLGYKSASEIEELRISEFNTEYLLIKCHDYEVSIVDKFRCFSLFIHRDVRDVYVSQREKWGVGIASIPKLVSSSNAALIYANKHDYFIQQYEDVYQNEEGALLQIAKYLNLKPIYALEEDLSESSFARSFYGSIFLILKKVARFRKHLKFPISRFEIYVKKLAYLKILTLSTDPKSQIHPDHRSKTGGKPGAWMGLLSDDERAVFEMNPFSIDE